MFQRHDNTCFVEMLVCNVKLSKAERERQGRERERCIVKFYDERIIPILSLPLFFTFSTLFSLFNIDLFNLSFSPSLFILFVLSSVLHYFSVSFLPLVFHSPFSFIFFFEFLNFFRRFFFSNIFFLSVKKRNSCFVCNHFSPLPSPLFFCILFFFSLSP